MSNEHSKPEPCQSAPAKWWRRFHLFVWVVDAIQILGLGGFVVASASGLATFAMGLFEGIPLTPLIPIAAAAFFVVLLGSFGLADRWRGWSAAKQSNPGMTADEFIAASNAQKDFYNWSAAFQSRTHRSTAIFTHMDVWKNAPDEDIDKFRLATAAFLTVLFDRATRREFLAEVAGAEPKNKRHVALSYLHGLLLRTMSEEI